MRGLIDIPWADEINYSMFSASHLARTNGTGITLQLFLAGLYLGCFERLFVYCSDWGKLTEFVVKSCNLEKPSWFYWAAIYEEMVSDRDFGMSAFDRDSIEVLRDAAEIALASRKESMLRLIDILRAIAKNERFDLCKGFVQSGLDLVKVTGGS